MSRCGLAAGEVAVLRDVSFTARARPHPRPRRRIRRGQEHDRPRRGAAAAGRVPRRGPPARLQRRGSAERFRRSASARCSATASPSCRRSRCRRSTRSSPSGGSSTSIWRGSACRRRERRAPRRASARRSAARPRRRTPRPLSVPAFGRHVPAGAHRHGVLERSRAHHRGRADDGARRHDPGAYRDADPRAAAARATRGCSSSRTICAWPRISATRSSCSMPAMSWSAARPRRCSARRAIPIRGALKRATPALDAGRGAGSRRCPTSCPGSRRSASFRGCRFAPRCPIADPDCAAAVPPLVEVAAGQWVRCTPRCAAGDGAALAAEEALALHAGQEHGALLQLEATAKVYAARARCGGAAAPWRRCAARASPSASARRSASSARAAAARARWRVWSWGSRRRARAASCSRATT